MKRLILSLLFLVLIQPVWCGVVKVKYFKTTSFDRIAVMGGFKIYLVQSKQAGVSLSGQEEILKRVKVSVKEKLLVVEMVKDMDRRIRLKRDETPTITISFVQINDIHIDGYAILKSRDSINLQQLSVVLNGSNRIEFNIHCNQLSLESSGASYIKLTGKGQDFSLKMNGAGMYDGYDLPTKNTYIEINGTGKARLFAKDSLKGSIRGLGTIFYKGSPNVTIHKNFGIVKHVDK